MRTFILALTTALFLATGCSDASLEEAESESATRDALTVGANGRRVFDYFVGVGLSPEQAAAIVGHLQQESSLDPRRYQDGGGPGRGIAQWETGVRWDGRDDDSLRAYVARHGGSIWSLDTQLAFMWWELENVPRYGLRQLRAARTLEAAVEAFYRFEGCRRCVPGRRLQYARTALASFGREDDGE